MKIKRCLIAALALVCLCGCNSSAPAENTSSESDESAVEITLGDEDSTPIEDAESADENENKEDGGEDGESSSSGDLKAVYNEIASTVSLPDMVELNDRMLERKYGLTSETVADYAGGLDSSGVGQDEIVLIKAADESNVADIQNALQTYYDSKLAQQENYNPEEAEKIRNCSVETNGLYVTLIVSNDADQITEIVNNSLN